MQRTTRNRILSVVLSLALILAFGCFLPVSIVSAAVFNTPLDFTLLPEDPDYPVEPEGGEWTWDADGLVLTLNGLNLICTGAPFAIMLPPGSSIVLAEGSVNFVSNDNSNGIQCYGDLNVSGAGDLSVMSYYHGFRVVGDLTIDGLNKLIVQSDDDCGLRVGKGGNQTSESEGHVSIANCGVVSIDSYSHAIRAIGDVFIDGIKSLTLSSDSYTGIRSGPDWDGDMSSGAMGNISVQHCGTVSVDSYEACFRTLSDILLNNIDTASFSSSDGAGLRAGPDDVETFETGAEADVTITNIGSISIDAYSSGIRNAGDVIIQGVEDLMVTAGNNGIRCGADDAGSMFTGAAGDLDIIDCGSVYVYTYDYNAVAAKGDMIAQNVTSLTMIGGDKGLKTWGSASFIDCGFVQAIGLAEEGLSEGLEANYDSGLSSYEGFGISSGTGVLIQNSTLEAYGAMFGIVTGYWCNEIVEPTGGDIVLVKANVDASCADYGNAAIFAGDDGVVHSSIVLDNTVIVTPENGYVADVLMFGADCQSVTAVPDLDGITDPNEIAKSVTTAAMYDVIYDANGGTGTFVDEGSPYLAGSTVTVAENTFVKDGFVFTGWNTTSDGTGTAYAEGDEFVIDSDVTLFAVYAPVFTVQYDANGGTGTLVDDASPYLGGSVVTVADNVFTKDGAVFTGWNTAADGSGTGYAEGDTFEIDSDVTLYAIFEEISVTPTPTPNPEDTVGLNGRLEDENGNLLGGRKIEIHSDVLTATTNSLGEFTFSDVLIGEHTIIIYEADGTTIAASLDIEIVQGSADSVDGNVITIEGDSANIVIVLEDDTLTIELAGTSPATSDPLTIPYLMLAGLAGIIPVAIRRRKR